MERKKFEIRAESKKKFEIRSEDLTTTQEWFRQTNDSDCGPCMILNSLRKIPKVRHVPSNVEEIRHDVNRLRRESGRQELQTSDWFTSEDIQEYFKDIAGLAVKEYALFQDSTDEIKWNIQSDLQRPFELLYGTAGRHFRALVPHEQGYELLDSFNEGPRPADTSAIDEFINHAARESTNGRIERIGIVRVSDRQN